MLVGSCATKRYSEKIEEIKDGIVFSDAETINKFSQTITVHELRELVYELSAKPYQGRETGEVGHDLACNFIQEFYKNAQISSPFGTDNYYQNIPESFLDGKAKSSQNVMGFIKGSTYPEELLIISAHSDHIGSDETGVYQGVDDNASGTSAVLEMAEAFGLAAMEGHLPKRSILFLHLTGEEKGLMGSRYYVQNPVFPLENTVANLNIDMIGRVDRAHKDNDNYIYIIGADRLSTELHYISEKANTSFTQLELDYKFNAENDVNRYYYRSDHYNFAKEGIPVIFYFNGEHEDYHLATDTPEKINYKLLTKRTRLIFATAWYLANNDQRLAVDENL